MGLFGGADDDVLPYVRELVEAAEGSTVTADALTDSRLNEPVLVHLDEREQPHHVLVARETPLGVNERGSTRTIGPADDLTTVTVLTDRRILFVVGREDGDETRSVEYGDVYGIEVAAGLRRSRLEVTLRDERYTAYFSRFVDANEVEDFLDRMTGRATASGRTAEEFQESQPSTATGTSPPSEDVEAALRSMDADEFERFVADLWRARGWTATVTRRSADRGIDVVATREDPFPRKHVLQVKRYAGDNPVGSPAIQQYASLDRQEDGVDAVVVVTTGEFTRQAERTAADLNVKLVDGDDLARLIEAAECHDLLATDGDSAGRGDGRPGESGSDGESEGDRAAEASDATGSTTGEEAEDLSVEAQSVIRSTGDSRGTYGSVLGHVVVALLTAWWTIGVGNLLYASWAYHHSTRSEPDPVEGPFEAPPSRNWYYGIPAGFALAVLSGVVGWTGLDSAAAAGLLAGWFLLLSGTYFDVQRVRAETEWNPITGWWLLGVGLLPLAVIAVPLYVLKRSFATASTGHDGVRGRGNAE